MSVGGARLWTGRYESTRLGEKDIQRRGEREKKIQKNKNALFSGSSIDQWD